MRIALAALGLLAALPVAAQAETTWTQPNLTISGNRTNGCDLRLVSVTHNGSTLNSLRFTFVNRAAGTMRVNAEVTMTGDNQRKSGMISGTFGAGQQMTLQGFHPFGGSLAGSTISIRVAACTPA